MSIDIMSAVFYYDMPTLKTDQGDNVPDSTAKFVLLALADHCNDEGEGAYPSVDTLCKKTSMSRQTVCNAINALRTNGYTTYEGESKRHTSNYTIVVKKLRESPITEPVQPLDSPKSSGWTDESLATRHEPSIKPSIKPKIAFEPKKPFFKGIEASVMESRATMQEDLDVSKNSWFGREKMPEPIRELLDIYVSLTNDRPSKGDLMDWLGTGNDWLEKGIIPSDLRRAYEKSKEGTGFLVNRPGSLTRTAGMFAGERRKKTEPVIIQEQKKEAPVSFDPNKPFYEQFPREEK